MKITVFGASGGTGKLLVEQALAAGHEVVAFVRNPAKLGIEHECLRIAQGDIEDAAAVDKAVQGVDAVISALGPARPGKAATGLTTETGELPVSRGMEHILAAMKRHGVKRLVVSVGAGVRDPKDAPGVFDTVMGWLIKTFQPKVYGDMRRVDALVRQSDRDWTIVRVPMLTNGPRTGRVKVAYVGKGMGRSIARADMAEFMLKQASERQYARQAPCISKG